ncbi:MAG: SlyX family protein, partial [Mariprofundaceae bacterium]
MGLDERIIELETRLSFQDRLVQELNDVIAGQQKQIDA